MTISLKKTVIGALAALSLGLAFSSPANAWGGWGPGAVAAGIIGGAVVGGAIANSANGPYYGPGPGGDCWLERRPIYDEYGNVIGRRRVRVCR